MIFLHVLISGSVDPFLNLERGRYRWPPSPISTFILAATS